MNKYLSTSLTNIVSTHLDSSWAAESIKEALIERQSRFQQKQMQEREKKLLELYENQQQRAFERVGRGSAGSNASVGSTGGGKVRQMFDERRQKAGVDRSYPLEPLKAKSNGTRVNSVDRNTRTVVKSTVQTSVSAVRNGNPVVNKREVVKSVYTNNNGKETFERNVYEDDGIDQYNSKSHRELIEMMNNHNIEDGLDYQEMPTLEFDVVDNYNHNTSNHNKRAVPAAKTPTKSNGLLRKDNETYPRKTASSSSSSPSKTPPKTTTVAKPTKPVNKTNLEQVKMQKAKAEPKLTPSSKLQTKNNAVSRDDLAECAFCSRRFATDRIEKHQEICGKTAKKKRKAYDATKHRVVGTDLESYVLKSYKGKAAASKPKPTGKKDWRRTHEDFIAAIRAAKEAQAHVARGGKLTDLPPPPPSSNPDYVQCPHCGRKFNQNAAERHIPKCANYQFNKPKQTAKGKK